MKKNELKKAIEFHGHLGPYLVLGMLMGKLAVKELQCRKHFGLEATVLGALHRPKSCLVDGIQVSCGCTYGKGNIKKIPGNKIQAIFRDIKNRKKIVFRLKPDLIERLDALKGHADSEAFAGKLIRINPLKLFNIYLK